MTSSTIRGCHLVVSVATVCPTHCARDTTRCASNFTPTPHRRFPASHFTSQQVRRTCSPCMTSHLNFGLALQHAVETTASLPVRSCHPVTLVTTATTCAVCTPSTRSRKTSSCSSSAKTSTLKVALPSPPFPLLMSSPTRPPPNQEFRA